MKLAKKHGPALFLLIMVFIMALVMSIVLSIVNGALAAGFWHVWPRQFVIAFLVALPVAYFARIVATRIVASATAPEDDATPTREGATAPVPGAVSPPRR